MAATATSKMRLVPNNNSELCTGTLSVEANPDFSEVHRQESGIFESSSSDFSDNCFSDDDIEWHSDDDDEVSTADDSLWDEFQQNIFLSPICAIKKPPLFNITANSCPVVEEDIPMIKLSTRNKKVTFKPDKELVTVHCMIAWDYAYRSCRKGPWERMAQDRVRFAKRIEEIGLVLEPCLKKSLSQMPSSH